MPDHRRKAKRYQARWKVALAFDRSTNKPVFHTLTHDLSMNGTAVQNQTDEKIHSVLTLLLVPPAIEGNPQNIIKLKAIVISSTPFRSGFRLGLSFIHDNELDKLRGVLERLDHSGDSLPSESLESAPAINVLDVIKQKALSKKMAEEQLATDKLEREKILFKRISVALMSAYRYFNELVEQLNSLNPAYPDKYPLLNVTEFSEMTWQEGARTDCFIRKSDAEERIFNKVTVDYKLANPQQIKIVREWPIHEKTRQVLEENGIAYRIELSKNDQGRAESAAFFFPCEVKAGLIFTGNDESGKLLLRTRNVERFGTMEFEFDIETLDQTLLNQLALMMLGEKHSIGKLIKRIA